MLGSNIYKCLETICFRMDLKRSEQPSVFNPALKYVESLAHLMDALDVMFMKGDLDGAYRVLMRIYNRVEHKFEKDKDSKKEIGEILKKAMPLLNNPKPSQQGELNEYLNQLDRKLKQIMNKAGLLMPSKEDPRFAVLQR